MSPNNKNDRVLLLPDLDNDESIKNLIKDIVKLELESKSEPIYLLIMSDGGLLSNTYALYSFLTKSTCAPIVTVGIANVISAANIIFAGGRLRIALTNTIFTLHKVSICPGNTFMSPEDLTSMKKELDTDTVKFFRVITEKRKHHLNPCKLRINDLKRMIKKSVDGDYTFGSDVALKYGFTDAVAKNISEAMVIAEEKLPLVQKKLKNRRK